MPTYEFIAADGSTIEEVHPMSKIPERIRRRGKLYKLAAFSRSNSSSFDPGQVKSTVHGYPRIDFTLPKGDLGAGTDAGGRPIIPSQAFEKNLIASSEGRMRRD